MENKRLGRSHIERKRSANSRAMKESCSLKDITSMLNTGNLTREKFFYLYYKRESGDADLDVRNFAKYLRNTVEREQP